MDEQQQSSSKKWMIIGATALILIIAIGAFLFLNRNSTSSPVQSITSLFGKLGQEISRPLGDIIQPGQGQNDGVSPDDLNAEEPLFRQLSTIPIAGATTITRDGKSYVRYIAKENGYTYEVDPRTGKTVQLTNTTIPRIYEAYWGNNGESVTLRFLARDAMDQDSIKTYLAYLSTPKQLDANASGTTQTLGTLIGDFLPDNISALSISQDGTKMFFLIPTSSGVTGYIMTLATKAKQEVFQSTFSEWSPQLLNSGMVILTTKPSANVEGYSYLYNPKDHSFSRILRKVNGLTTLANKSNTRVLYSENLLGKTLLNVHNAKGYIGDEGSMEPTIQVPLPSLPEKCAWGKNQIRLYCGSFTSTPRGQIPDDWYQGVIAFSDMFWSVNTDTSEISFLADPTKEETAQNGSFDVIMPFVDDSESHFFFINKNDMTLWSMRINKEKFITPEESTALEPTEELTPDELKDAAGSQQTQNSTSTKKK